MKNVLVIGSTGYAGTHVSAGFARAGYRVSALQRPGGRTVHEAYRPVPGDLADPSSLVKAAADYDWVVHIGAIMGEELDLAGVDALQRAGSPLIFTSGSDVVGAGLVDEESEPRPHPFVGWRDKVERKVLEGGGRVVRPGLIYGRGGGVVTDMMIPMANRFGAGVYIGERGVRWGAVHVTDLPSLYLAIAERAAPGTVWHATGGNVRVDELADLTGGGRSISWPEHEEPPFEIAVIAGLFRLDQVVSSERTQRMLGWRPAHTDAVASLAAEFAAAHGVTAVGPR